MTQYGGVTRLRGVAWGVAVAEEAAAVHAGLLGNKATLVH